MKIQYQRDPFLEEDYVEVHYREESEGIKTICLVHHSICHFLFEMNS